MFEQDDLTVTLATAQPDADFGFHVTITIPANASDGAAVIVAQSDYLTLQAGLVVRAEAPVATPNYAG